MQQKLTQFSLTGAAVTILLMIAPQEAFAMHIMEGFYRRCGLSPGG
ncbi:hypothetical protein ACNQTB_12315 [Corynebacterium diphtheriae]